jgi:neopullulanase
LKDDGQIKTPEWVKDCIFYQIFPDRFAKSNKVPKPSNLEDWNSPPTLHGYKGGDLLGIVEKLDYLQDLGITALYLNPIFQSTANHRYHTHDYFLIDPILGGNEAFKILLDEAHARGIYVMIDGVFNHASRGFYQFSHALENGAASPYLDWFHFKGFPVNAYNGRANYDAWWGIPALPKFNTRTQAVRDYLMSVGRFWLEFGADGWRLDVPNEIDDDEFWREFRRQVKGVNPQAYICGEIWENARRWLQGDQFDSVMNYLFTRGCLSFFIQQSKFNPESIKGTSHDGHGGVRMIDAVQFGIYIKELLDLYAHEINLVQLNLLDSHDTPRYLTIAGEDKTALKLATLFQMTYPGAPSIYYGDEIGLSGFKDPDSRRAFPWDESSWDHELRNYFKRVIALRKVHPALRRGEYDMLFAVDGIHVHGRYDTSERLIIILNVNDHPLTMFPPLTPNDRRAYFSEEGYYVDVFANPGTIYSFSPEGAGFAGFELPARSGTVLKFTK